MSSVLNKRIFSSIILISLIATILNLNNIFFLIFLIIVFSICSYEWLKLVNKNYFKIANIKYTSIINIKNLENKDEFNNLMKKSSNDMIELAAVIETTDNVKGTLGKLMWGNCKPKFAT